MKVQLSNLSVLALFLFITACTPSKYKTMIVGRWEPSKVEFSEKKSLSLSDTSTLDQRSAEKDRHMTEIKHAIFEQKGMTNEEMVKQTLNTINEYQTTYYFDRGGMFSSILDNGEGQKGTWRLTTIGKLLILTFPETSQEIKYKIYSITLSEMVIRNINFSKGMRFTYLKK